MSGKTGGIQDKKKGKFVVPKNKLNQSAQQIADKTQKIVHVNPDDSTVTPLED